VIQTKVITVKDKATRMERQNFNVNAIIAILRDILSTFYDNVSESKIERPIYNETLCNASD